MFSIKNKTVRSNGCWNNYGKNLFTCRPFVFGKREILHTDSLTENDYGEIIEKGAFDNCDLSDITMRLDHGNVILARTRGGSLKVEKDGSGIVVKADLNKSPYHGIMPKIDNTTIFSIAFDVSSEEYEPKTRTRIIKNISKVHDISVLSLHNKEEMNNSDERKNVAFKASGQSARQYFLPIASNDAKGERTNIVNRIKNEVVTKANNIPAIPSGLTFAKESIDEYKKQIFDIRDNFDSKVMNNPYDAKKMAETVDSLKDEMAKVVKFANSNQRQKLSPERLNYISNHWAEEKEKIDFDNLDPVKPLFGFNGSHPEKYYRENFNTGEKSMTFENNRNSIRNYAEGLFTIVNSAGTASTMSDVIPTHILDAFICENAPMVLLNDASRTNIPNVGTLKLPIGSLQTINQHTENQAITDASPLPTMLSITHNEYAYNAGYSDLGMETSIDAFSQIVEEIITKSMLKKMDGLCLAAIAGLTYTSGTNAVQIASGSAPTLNNLITLAGYLTGDYLTGANWYMNANTWFTWMMGLLDGDSRPFFDITKKLEEQAPLGYPVKIDNQIPDKVIYFGNGNRVHFNSAREPEVNKWTDFEHNTDKIGIRCVVGANVETGSFVKMYQAS